MAPRDRGATVSEQTVPQRGLSESEFYELLDIDPAHCWHDYRAWKLTARRSIQLAEMRAEALRLIAEWPLVRADEIAGFARAALADVAEALEAHRGTTGGTAATQKVEL